MKNIFRFSFFIVTGAIAQLGEHLLCKQGVRGSIPRSSTNFLSKLLAKIDRTVLMVFTRTISTVKSVTL